MNHTVTARSAALPPHYSAPPADRPQRGHLCTGGKLGKGDGTHCAACLSAKTLQLAAEMKSVLNRHVPTGPARAALRTLLPAIVRVCDGIVGKS